MGLKDFFRNLLRTASGDVQPTLDLHGLSVKEALRLTEEFVAGSSRSGVSPVRIVYGKGLGSPGGRGVLREIIPRWCEKEGNRWVKSYRREVDPGGGDGRILLFLRKEPLSQADPDTERGPEEPGAG
jgi:DNA-nicking Smr family endonuclease